MIKGTYEPIVAAILAAVTFRPKPSLDSAPFDTAYSLNCQLGFPSCATPAADVHLLVFEIFVRS